MAEYNVASAIRGHAAERPDAPALRFPSATYTTDRPGWDEWSFGQLAAECDFFSVGTNDLIQYLLAVDRTNQQVAHIYEPLHPSVLRCLKRIVEVASQEGIPAIVCGEMASDPVHVVVLVALGFDRFSMTPSQIPLISRVISALDHREALELGEELLELHTTAEIEAHLTHELPRRFPDFFKE